MYSGTLQIKYGIIQLLEAFNFIKDEDYSLLICGDGEAKEEVIKACKIDKRIIYLGSIERDKVLLLQKSCTLLVNPRQNNDEYTKYSFPSKIMEYLQSGTPVLAYKLDGIPDEYDDYIFYVSDNSPYSLSLEIMRISSMSNEKMYEIGQKSKKFIQSDKNHIVQSEKILEMFRKNEQI